MNQFVSLSPRIRKYFLGFLALILCLVLVGTFAVNHVFASPALMLEDQINKNPTNNIIALANSSTNSLTTPSDVFLPLIMKEFSPSAWNVLLSENFEGNFPGAWSLHSYWFNGTDWQDVTSEVFWGKRNCYVPSGNYAGWAVGGGSYGSALPCDGGYVDELETWMVFGPVDLSQVHDAYLSIKIWLDIEPTYDEMGWGVSLDGNNFYGNAYSGYSGIWFSDAIDLKDVYTLGNVTAQSQVWIGIWFDSAYSNLYFYEGVAVDDLVLSTCSMIEGCTGSPVLSGFREIPAGFNQEPFTRTMQK